MKDDDEEPVDWMNSFKGNKKRVLDRIINICFDCNYSKYINIF